ncbi:MAG: zinc ribbon domain-containing protein [Gemmatimonadota bacterium]|nr:zinc ribbon domain-containing protein [Gemmatimonadota bacterium]
MNIPDGILPLAAGTVLALAALSVVLAPLLSSIEPVDETPPARMPFDANAEGTAIAALREIEFDRATGKLSDTDYESLRASYTRDALAELRAADRDAPALNFAPGTVTDEVLEAAILRARNAIQNCTVCGQRPEPDAIFCSSCGRYLPGGCRYCDTPVVIVGARFCVACGEGLAAV